jgi:serine/threonine-protein kinase
MSISPPANPLAPGFRLDRYELLWPLAEGGMASVWLARLHGKRGFEKLVAVKTILPKFASDPRFQSMFLDEARIAAGIEHTNVTRVLDLGEEHGVLYIAMEFVDGDSLAKLQRVLARAGVPLPVGVVLRVMADASAGLHAAHELRGRDGTPLGIVHRDVSPQNILVSAEGAAKIIDFGVAKARDRVSEETSSGSLKGKIQYMAPEQALGRAVDRRADVWAIGAILYYFFSGRKVYEADSELATLQLLTSGAPPQPLPMTVHPAIAEIIHGTLQFDVGQRTPNLDIVRRQLEDAMFQMNCVVRPEDVATFIATYAAERAAARRTIVEKALQAGDARVALAEKPTAPSSSGLLDVHARPAHALLTRVGPPPAAPRNENSSATLGSTALDAAPASRRTPVGLWFAGAAAVGALAAGVAGLVIALRPSAPVSQPATFANAEPPAVPASPVPAPTVPPAPSAAAPPPTATAPAVVAAAPAASAADAPSPPSMELDTPPSQTPTATPPHVAKAAPPASKPPASGSQPAAASKPAAKRTAKKPDSPDDGF